MMQDVIATQRARAFAAHTAEKAGKPMVAKQILEGGADQNWRVKLFARFQAEIEAATIERCAGVAHLRDFECEANARKAGQSVAKYYNECRAMEARHIKSEILNLKGQTS